MKRREILRRERYEELKETRRHVIDSRGGTRGALKPKEFKHFETSLHFTKEPKVQAEELPKKVTR